MEKTTIVTVRPQDVDSVLAAFQLPPRQSCRVIADTQRRRGGRFAVRIVVCVTLVTGKRIILRFINEQSFILDISKLSLPTRVLERQSEFSELLRQNGLIVPEKFQVNGRYCYPYEISGVTLDVTAEAYLGEAPAAFTPELFGEFGRLLGQIHKISLENRFRIGFSILFREQAENRADYLRIFAPYDTEKLDQETLRAVRRWHDAQSACVRSLWGGLPFSAVQGDIYSCNNIALTDAGIGFFDFNIASDEVLLGDFFHMWFRTLYDPDHYGKKEDWNTDQCFEDYWRGYTAVRPFTPPETAAFSQVQALMRCIFQTRSAAMLLGRGKPDEARRELQDLYHACVE